MCQSPSPYTDVHLYKRGDLLVQRGLEKGAGWQHKGAPPHSEMTTYM